MNVITFDRVDKYYYRHNQRTLKELVQAVFDRQNTLERIHVLRGISFSINKGEVVGILGKNGAGKSTLLKLIARVSKPTYGNIRVVGKIAPMIELGAGFHPELSGEENIYLNGIILGLTEEQVAEKIDSIVDFAEIGEFIDMPVKHYSSGMFTRLAFSIAISIDPDILLVDEVLSVGDLRFQRKCMQRMNEYREKGVTIIIVSHNQELIKSFCKRVIVLERGGVVYDGPVADGVKSYEEQF